MRMDVTTLPEAPDVLIVDDGYLAATWPFFSHRLCARLQAADLTVHSATLKPGQHLRNLPGIKDVPALVVVEVEPDVDDIAALRNLTVVAGVAGREGLAVSADLAERGIPYVDGTIRGRSTSQAEVVIGLMLCALRGLPHWHNSMIAGPQAWPDRTWQYSDHCGYVNGTIRGKAVVVFGLDLVGQQVAGLCAAFGAQVWVVDPLAEDALLTEIGAQRIPVDEVPAVAQIIVLAGNFEAPNLAGPLIDELAHGALVVTVSSVATIDMPALRRRVLDNELFWATDCYLIEPVQAADPILGRDNVVHLPAIGARTRDANIAAADVLADNIGRVLAGGPPLRWDCVRPETVDYDASTHDPTEPNSASPTAERTSAHAGAEGP